MAKKVSYKRPPCCPIFLRVFTLALFFAVSVFTAATWFSWGLNWIMDIGSGSTDTYPLWQCPDFYFNTDGRALNQGPRCRMSITYNDSTIFAMRAFNYDGTYNLVSASDERSPGQCVIPGSGEETITCYALASCQRSCIRYVYSGQTLVSSETCPDPDTLVSNDESECYIIMAYSNNQPAVYFTAPCKGVSAGTFCDSDYRVTPSNMIAIRGLAAGSLLIVLIWFFAEMVLWKVDCDLRKEAALGRALQDETLAPKKETLIHMVERAWEEEYEKNLQESNLGGSTVADFTPKSHRSGHLTVPNSNSNSGYPPKDDRSVYTGYTAASGGSAGRTALDSRDPKKRFESSGWRRKIRQWTRLKEEKKSMFSTRALIRNVLMNFFFLLILVFTMWIILTYSPAQMNARGSIVEVLQGEASIWDTHSWLDVIIFVDILLDVGLFLVAVAVVHWPKPPVFTRHLHAAADEALAKLEAGEEREEGSEGEARRLRSGDRESTGSLSEGSFDDNKTLSSRPSHESLAFVVNQSLTSDVCLMIACHESTLTAEKYEVFTNTLRSALMVFPPSHIFVCDNGGSAHPVDDTQMAAKEVHPDINYLYVPEGNKTFAFYWCNRYWIPFLARHGRIPDFKYAIIIDDDVPLPADLHIPHEHLKQNPNIKAVHFPITASSPDGNPNLLVRCQDIEYKMAAVHKYFQSTVSRTLSCHGAIALWKRDTMDSVFYDHDTVFHGEDLYMGLSLLRRRDESKIISAPQSIVPTYAPDTMGMLFRQRVKSWEITSHKKTFTYLLEVFHPWSLCHGPSWALKPYFIQELLTIMLDWLRMFLLCGLLLRDWLGLCIMMAMFTLILYLQVVIFQVIYLRQRPDLKSSFCTVLTFPWYRLCGLIFRLCALCQNLLVYSKERKNQKIGVREDEIRDIPPLPPHPEVNWFDVWLPKPDPPEELRKRSKRGSSRASRSRRGSLTSRASRASRTPEAEEGMRSARGEKTLQ